MNSRLSPIAIATAWLVLAGPALAGPGDSPRAWLEQMSAAMSQMSYQGTFVYVQGDEVVTMRVTHVADESGVRERLVSVSGAPREVLRDSEGVRWVLGEDQSVLADSAFQRSFFPELALTQQDGADRYMLKLGASERIAGQKAQVVKVLPRDNYRYGYTLWLEERSGLLLKWELVNSDRKAMAKLMFTEIRMGSEVDLGELQPGGHLNRYKTVESSLPQGQSGAGHEPVWEPQRLPPGFQLTNARHFDKKDAGIYEHLVYSDGLAAVSVYVETRDPSVSGEPGTSRLGTMHAYSRHTDEVAITVVGDVPALTVRLIGDAVARSSR
jgi:sigma-E factor negative regulatory protein RseB